MEGWLNAYREGGWLPSWASPGYRNSMVGTYADVVVSDAVVKNIPHFSLVTAMEALRKDSSEVPPKLAGGAVGKEGLLEYEKLGYLPVDSYRSDCVSRTLDFAYADYSTSKAFLKLASLFEFQSMRSQLEEESSKLRSRAENAVRKLYHSGHNLMVPKDRNGVFQDIDPISWGSGYVEGSAWQHSFPPWAIDILIKLYGNKMNLINKLKELLDVPSNFNPGSYGDTIHEMREMQALAMGQYAHNNQPAHHILYLFALLGMSSC